MVALRCDCVLWCVCAGFVERLVWLGKIKIKIHAVATSRVGGRVSLCAGALSGALGPVVAA